MRIMDRYILREYLKPLAYCLLTFTMFFVIWDLFAHLGRMLEARTPGLLIARYYISLVLPTMEFLVPASLLLATLYTLWQFSRNNELTAMRASGVSLYRILSPFTAVGVAMTLLVAVDKETVAPSAAQWADEFKDNHFVAAPEKHEVRNFPYANPLQYRQWRIDALDLKNPSVLHGVQVTQERPDGSRARRITADRAEWLDGEWWFYGVSVQHYDTKDGPIGKPDMPAPDPEAALPMPYLTETPEDFIVASKPPEFLTAREIRHYIDSHPNISDKRMTERWVDFHCRLAMPWACLVLTLFGIPAGGRNNRQSVVSGVFLAIALLLAFYGIMVTGVNLAKREVLSPWLGAWLSNIVFLISGFGMLLKMR